MLLSHKHAVTARSSRAAADGTHAARPMRMLVRRLSPLQCASTNEQPAMTIEKMDGILKEMDKATGAGDSAPPQASRGASIRVEGRSLPRLRATPSTPRLEQRVLEQVTATPDGKGLVTVSDAFTLTKVLSAIHVASQQLQQQGSGEVIVFSPSVRRDMLPAFLRNGATPDSELYLNLSKVPAPKTEAEPNSDSLLKTSNETRWEGLSGIANRLLATQGEACISAVGGPAIAQAMKAVVSSKVTSQRELGAAVWVRPVVKTVPVADGANMEVMQLYLTKAEPFPGMVSRARREDGVSRQSERREGGPVRRDREGSDRSPRVEGSDRRPATRRERPARGPRREARDTEAAKATTLTTEAGAGDVVTVSAAQWKAINDQIEMLTKFNTQLAELVNQQLKRQ